MTGDHSERVSQLQLKIAQFENERQHAIGEQRDDLRSLKDTLLLSQRVVTIASAPAIVWILCWAFVLSANESISAQLMTAGFSLGVLAIMSAAAARASGLFAYWWFNRTVVSQRMGTVVVSLVAAATLFGWVLVIARW